MRGPLCPHKEKKKIKDLKKFQENFGMLGLDDEYLARHKKA